MDDPRCCTTPAAIVQPAGQCRAAASGTGQNWAIQGASNRVFQVVLGAIAALQVLLFVFYLNATIISVPFWDMLSFVDTYISYRETGQLWAYLWLPDNEHHSVWSRLLTVTDINLFDGAGYAFHGFSTVCLVACPVMLWRELCRSSLAPELSLIGGTLLSMLFLTTALAVDCSIPMNGGYPQAVCFMLLALTLLDGNSEGGEHWSPRRFAALAAAMAASLSNGIGLLSWPLLLWTAWLGGLGWRWIVAIGAIAALFGGVYFYGMDWASTPASAKFDGIPNVGKVANYAITFLGLPWTRSALLAGPGRLAGATLLISGVMLGWHYGIRRRPVDRLQRIAVGLILLSLGAAAVAAVGRVDLADKVKVPVRYTILVVPLQAGLICLALPLVARYWDSRGRLLRAGILGVASLLLVQQIPAGRAAEKASLSITTTLLRFRAGHRDENMHRIVFPDLSAAARILSRIESRGLYRWMPNAGPESSGSWEPKCSEPQSSAARIAINDRSYPHDCTGLAGSDPQSLQLSPD